ncbi:hypothetical protein GCM10009865_19560 [Aeromicrobium ponti]
MIIVPAMMPVPIFFPSFSDFTVWLKGIRRTEIARPAKSEKINILPIVISPNKFKFNMLIYE